MRPSPTPVPSPPQAPLDATAPHLGSETLRGPHVLVFCRGKSQSFALPAAGEVLIGRGEEAHIRIDDESVSRRHAMLRVGATWEIEDLGSRNGTKLGAAPLKAHELQPVAAGDVIELGGVLLVPRGVPAAPTATQAHRAQGDKPRLQDLIDRLAPTEISLLLLGETGVGKEVMARRIHERSGRCGRPFVAIHCGAIPETLLESELFGHEAGAFTGAQGAKPGLFETAAGGTVLLDEVGELASAAQVKLLRVLETRQVQRVGGLAPRELDVRFIAATHRDLRAAVAAGTFREDLYYRLAGFVLTVAPLRERLDELPELATAFIGQLATRLERPAPALGPAALARLCAHPWPGNLRELRNVMERAFVLCDGPELQPEHLVFEATATPVETPTGERGRILAALQACAGNQTRAAKQLNMSRKTLGLKMDSLGIPRPQKHGRS